MMCSMLPNHGPSCYEECRQRLGEAAPVSSQVLRSLVPSVGYVQLGCVVLARAGRLDGYRGTPLT